MLTRWLVVPAAIALLAFGAVACGGGNDNKDNNDSNGAGPTSEATTPSDSGNNGDNGNGGSGLSDIASKFESSSFRATYNFSSSGEESLQGEMVLYKDGKDRFRFDVNDMQSDQGSLSFIETSDQTLLCLSDPAELGQLLGLDEGQGVCLQTDAGNVGDPVTAGLSGIFADIEDVDQSVVDTSERTIAGQDAKCYTANANAGTEQYCFGDNGVLLYFKSEGPGNESVEMEAQSFNSDVNSDAFDPPYEVREFPGIGGSGQ